MSDNLALKWTDVESSNVSQLAYDEQSMTLAVRFIGNSLYTYDGVDPQQYAELANAPSVGRYLNQAIKGSYPYLKHEDNAALIAHVFQRREQT